MGLWVQKKYLVVWSLFSKSLKGQAVICCIWYPLLKYFIYAIKVKIYIPCLCIWNLRSYVFFFFLADFLDNNISITVFGWVMDINNTTLVEDGDQSFCCRLVFIMGRQGGTWKPMILFHKKWTQLTKIHQKGFVSTLGHRLPCKREVEVEEDTLLLQV